MNLARAIGRANSHLRYWRYRLKLNNGGPTLLASLGDWCRRLRFELKENACELKD
jgi:hypothetical protein